MSLQNEAAPPRAGRREWIGLAVIALGCVLYVMDLTVLHPGRKFTPTSSRMEDP